jgi:hypothetical protein
MNFYQITRRHSQRITVTTSNPATCTWLPNLALPARLLVFPTLLDPSLTLLFLPSTHFCFFHILRLIHRAFLIITVLLVRSLCPFHSLFSVIP